MSKKRNRNVRTYNLPQNDSNKAAYRSNCEKNIIKNQTDDSNAKYFGEAVVWTSGDSSTGNSSQIFRKKSFPGSSSSSLSWSDEYEVEQSKKVLEELNRLDKVFRRIEPIPSDYDAEEIEEWLECFPGLTILDEKKPSCDNPITSKPKTETVIKKIYENVSNKLMFNSEKHRKAHVSTAPQKDNFLAVEVPVKVAPFRRTLSKRNQSSKSLFNQDYKRDDYISLPYLHNVFNTNKRKLPPSRRRTTDRLVLPPIHNFRSMSTLPSNDGNNNSNKTSLVIPMKSTNDKKLHNNNRLENFFLENSLSNTTREFLQDSSHKRFVFQ